MNVSTVLLIASMALGLVVTGSTASSAAPEPDLTTFTTGSLDAREINITGCSFPLDVSAGAVPCTLPSSWFYPATANLYHLLSGSCLSAGQNTGAASVGGTPNCSFYIGGSPVGPAPTTPTTNALADIFSGHDVNGFPDLPDVGDPLISPTNGTVGARLTCTTTVFNMRDISPRGACNGSSNAENSPGWAIIEGYVVLPATSSGNVIVQMSNSDLSGGTSREQYFAFLAAVDGNPANLSFRGEAQTAFGSTRTVNLTVPTSVGTGAGACHAVVAYVRMYHFDNYAGSSTAMRWSLDGGATYSAIPVANLSRTNPSVSAPCSPSLSLSKVADPTIYRQVGDQVTYTFAVTNTGNSPLTDVVVSDPSLPGLSCAPIAVLAVDTTVDLTCTGSVYTVTPADVTAQHVTNTATASGATPSGSNVSASASATSQLAALTTLKAASTVSFDSVGDEVSYTITVTNSGGRPLTGVTIADPNADAGSTLFVSSTANSPDGTLAVGESATYSAIHTVTQADLDAGSVTNVATASGSAGPGLDVSDPSDPVIVPSATSPALTLIKTVSPVVYTTVGDQLDYTFTVTNSGPVTISNVTVSDPMLAGLSCTPVTLTPNQTSTLTCTGAAHVVTAGDIATGNVTNVATVSGTPSTGTLIPATATASASLLTQPTAVDDLDSVSWDTTLDDTVATNDIHPAGSSFTAGPLDDPAAGVLVLDVDGSFSFNPSPEFTGTVSFDYTVCLPVPHATVCDTATQTIVVGPPPPGVIAGTVVVDGSGLPLPNVTIRLVGITHDHRTVELTTTTDATGSYRFSDVPPGSYTIIEIQPSGFGPGVIIPGNERQVALAPGASVVAQDFSESGGAIAGTVFVDGSNAPVPDIEIQLWTTDGRLVATVRTGPDGTYRFDGLPLGSYVVIEVQPSWLNPGVVAPSNRIAVDVVRTEPAMGQDFSETTVPLPAPPSTLAYTGLSTQVLMVLAGAAIGAGIVLQVLAHRRFSRV